MADTSKDAGGLVLVVAAILIYLYLRKPKVPLTSRGTGCGCGAAGVNLTTPANPTTRGRLPYLKMGPTGRASNDNAGPAAPGSNRWAPGSGAQWQALQSASSAPSAPIAPRGWSGNTTVTAVRG